MQNIQDDATRARIAARIQRLRPDSPAAFGTLDAPRMLCHIADQVRVALGERESHQRRSRLRHAPLRWIALRLPMPKARLGTVREMLVATPTTFEADRAELLALLERLAHAETTAPHPVFGPLSPRAWGEVTWKHFDHHLRQFGA